jgi:hypothetical protein
VKTDESWVDQRITIIVRRNVGSFQVNKELVKVQRSQNSKFTSLVSLCFCLGCLSECWSMCAVPTSGLVDKEAAKDIAFKLSQQPSHQTFPPHTYSHSHHSHTINSLLKILYTNQEERARAHHTFPSSSSGQAELPKPTLDYQPIDSLHRDVAFKH